MPCHKHEKKSEVFSIRCEGLDIHNILEHLQVRQGNFPCKYLGLPLRIGKAKRADEQVLIDRVANKLPRWKGKLLNKTGRLTLINSVLSAIVLYHMTVSLSPNGQLKGLIKSDGIFSGMGMRRQRVVIALLIGEDCNVPRNWVALEYLI
jgi:hypothetical protein